eukprot:1086116-Pleurochrysis_carterae.AAC.1
MPVSNNIEARQLTSRQVCPLAAVADRRARGEGEAPADERALEAAPSAPLSPPLSPPQCMPCSC